MNRVRYEGIEAEQRRARQKTLRTAVRIALIAWFVLVVIYFLSEMTNYSGLYATLSEFEFRNFGRNFPVTNFSVLVLIFSLPSIFLLRSKSQRDEPILPFEADLQRAQGLRRILGYAASGLGIAALASIIVALFIAPGFDPQSATREVEASSATVETGPGVVRGDILFSRSAIFALDAISTGHDTKIVPIVAPGQAKGPLRFFAEYNGDEVADNAPDQAGGSRAGVIQRDRVPPPILVLYRDAGYEVASPAYLVSRSKAIVSAQYWGLAFMLGVAGLVAWGLYRLQLRHVRRMAPGLESSGPAPEAPATIEAASSPA